MGSAQSPTAPSTPSAPFFLFNQLIHQLIKKKKTKTHRVLVFLVADPGLEPESPP